jgi:hypothetical protein
MWAHKTLHSFISWVWFMQLLQRPFSFTVCYETAARASCLDSLCMWEPTWLLLVVPPTQHHQVFPSFTSQHLQAHGTCIDLMGARSTHETSAVTNRSPVEMRPQIGVLKVKCPCLRCTTYQLTAIPPLATMHAFICQCSTMVAAVEALPHSPLVCMLMSLMQ